MKGHPGTYSTAEPPEPPQNNLLEPPGTHTRTHWNSLEPPEPPRNQHRKPHQTFIWVESQPTLLGTDQKWKKTYVRGEALSPTSYKIYKYL